MTSPNSNEALRQRVHLAMLKKSENAKNMGELTVVPIGFAVDVALQLIDEAVVAARIDELENMSDFVSAKDMPHFTDRIAALTAQGGKRMSATTQTIREELRDIVTRNGKAGRIPEFLDEELDKLVAFLTRHQDDKLKHLLVNNLSSKNWHTCRYKGEKCTCGAYTKNKLRAEVRTAAQALMGQKEGK